MPRMVHPRRASEPIFADDLGIQVEGRACFAPRFIGDVGPHDTEPPSIADGCDCRTKTGCLQRQAQPRRASESRPVRRGDTLGPGYIAVVSDRGLPLPSRSRWRCCRGFRFNRFRFLAASSPTATEAKLFGKPGLLPIAHRSATPTLWPIPGPWGHSATLSIAGTISALAPCSPISRFAARHTRRSSPFTATPLHFA
jgi:hypothetical protein